MPKEWEKEVILLFQMVYTLIDRLEELGEDVKKDRQDAGRLALQMRGQIDE
jgi:hypothetical protein